MTTSKSRFDDSKSVDRRYLSKYVSKKLNRSISFFHVQSVISILFEEIVKDLDAGKSITIGNFGKFLLKILPPRKHYNFYEKRYQVSPGNRIIRFQLKEKLRVFLIKLLDIGKTFEDDDNGK